MNLESRLLIIFLLGASAGAAVNWAVYRLAWRQRAIGPWTRPDPAAPPRRWSDRLPIVGWLGLRREAAVWGRGFWIRPMLVEQFLGLGLAALYWWEVPMAGLLPRGWPLPLPDTDLAALHTEYAAHVLLIVLMLAASLIDIDERIIPDAISVPGTLIGLALITAWPQALLPCPFPGAVGPTVDHLWLTVPNSVPPWLGVRPEAVALAIGLGCWWLWCVGLLPRAWYGRYGFRRALGFFVARLTRHPGTKWTLAMGLGGSAAIAALWHFGGPHWAGLLTALVGMAATGGLIWVVRILGTAALRREAMGFGDVTLMAMIGAFLGWQSGLIIFFLAPLAGLVLGVLQMILFRENEIPYGPFLCLAALTTIVAWASIWDRARPIFGLGALVPLILVVCLLAMAVLLRLWRAIREAF